MALLANVDVYRSTFVCALAGLMEEKILNAQYGIECNGDPSTRIKEINAYLWLLDNPDCEITETLFAKFKRTYSRYVGTIYDCNDPGPCISSETNGCTGLYIIDKTVNPQPCSLTTIEILL